jgi:hypothetical protein
MESPNSSPRKRQSLASASEHNDRDRGGQSRSYMSSRMESPNSSPKKRQVLASASEHNDRYRSQKYTSSSLSRRESSKSPDPPRRWSSSKDAKRSRSVSRDRKSRVSDGGRRRYKNSESISEQESEYDDRYRKDADAPKSRERRESSKSPEPPSRRSRSEDAKRSRSVSGDGRRRDSDGGRRRYKNSESISAQEREYDDKYRRDADVLKSRERRESSKSPEPPSRRSSSKDARRSRSVSGDGRRRDSDGGRRRYKNSESISAQESEYDENDADAPIPESRRLLKRGSSILNPPASPRGSRSRSLSSSRDGSRRDADGDSGRDDSFGLDEEQQKMEYANKKDEKYAPLSDEIRSPKRRSVPKASTSLQSDLTSPTPRRSGSKSPRGSKSPVAGRRGSMSRSRQKDSNSSNREQFPVDIPELSSTSTSLSGKESPKQAKSSRRASREISSPSDHTDGSGRRARASRKNSSADDFKEDSRGWKTLQKKLASSSKNDESVQSISSIGSTRSKPRRGRKANLLSSSYHSLGVETKNQTESENDGAKESKRRSKSRERKSRSESFERRKTSDDGSAGGGVSRRRKREMDRAAVVIQKWTRQRRREMDTAAVVIQKWTRRILKEMAIQRRLLNIQTMTRRFRESDFTFRMDHDTKFRVEAPSASLRIQRMIRGYQAKTTLHRLKNDKERRIETASILIQTTMRIYLAKMTRQRAKWRKEYEWQRDYEKYKPQKAMYLEYVQLERLRQHHSGEEIKVVEEKLAIVKQEYEKERAKMVETLEIQKKIWGDVIRRRVEQDQAKKALEEEEQGEQLARLGLDPKAELEAENSLMKEWIKRTRAKTKAKEEEGKELEKANTDVETMFHELNAFAKKKVAEKKDLSGEQLMLSKLLIPKAAKKSEKVTEEAKSEVRSKLMHRRSIYKVFEGVRSRDAHDHELYEEVKVAIQECEAELSAELLEGDRMKELLVGDVEALYEMELAGLNLLGDIPSAKAADSGWNSLAKGVLANLGKKEKLTWDSLDSSMRSD